MQVLGKAYVTINIGLALICELPQRQVNAFTTDVYQRSYTYDQNEMPTLARSGGLRNQSRNQRDVDDDNSSSEDVDQLSTTRRPRSRRTYQRYDEDEIPDRARYGVTRKQPDQPSPTNTKTKCPGECSSTNKNENKGATLQVNGIFPSLTATATEGPNRSGSGTGALMAWADKLYMVSYLSIPDARNGSGLYAIDNNFKKTNLASHNSTFANRMHHRQTNQIVIGAWVIDMHGNHKAFEDLLTVRVAATAEHLTNPENMVYMLGMDGPLWECNVTSLACSQLIDLRNELNITNSDQSFFKAAHTMNGRLVVASTSSENKNSTSQIVSGRLAEWEGAGHNWTIVEEAAFGEVNGIHSFGPSIYALGWDYKSVLLKVFDGSNPENHWQTYRLPKGSQAFDHLWKTESPRIREVETERYLMDMHGLFYELSPPGSVGGALGIKPISQHLRVVPDFTSFSGFLVLGGNQASSDNNVVTGHSQSGLWFGKTDDLWSFGKPQGWGAVWWAENVTDDTVSDPFLLSGFVKKVVHVILHESNSATIDIEVDITGAAGHRSDDIWVTLTSLILDSTTSYKFFTFPVGYSAHWVRARVTCPETSCQITAYFHFT